MQKPDYSDLEDSESLRHIWSFAWPIVLFVALILWAGSEFIG